MDATFNGASNDPCDMSNNLSRTKSKSGSPTCLNKPIADPKDDKISLKNPDDENFELLNNSLMENEYLFFIVDLLSNTDTKSVMSTASRRDIIDDTLEILSSMDLHPENIALFNCINPFGISTPENDGLTYHGYP
jgi:hypothetical protein